MPVQTTSPETIPEPRGFIFDLDGTLVDSNDFHVEAWDRAFRHFGKSFSREQLRAEIGKGSDQYLPAFLSPQEIKDFGKDLDEYRSKIFKEDYLEKILPFPHARELLERIYEDEKQIVLATSGKEEDTEHFIEKLGIREFIIGYTSADDAEQSKPEPDIFQSALAKLKGMEAAEVLCVGDTRFDVIAAKKIGVRTIALLCGGTDESALRREGALAVYPYPADLLAHYGELWKDPGVSPLSL